MERIWMHGTVAVAVALVDFHDPALADRPDARERGVRVEVRPARWDVTGSAYSSPALSLAPGTVRVDLLESAPGAADRMHWHPDMRDGEPGERTFDPAMVEDPAGWVRGLLTRLDERVPGEIVDEVVDVTAALLARAREPWPDVVHDHRGLVPD